MLNALTSGQRLKIISKDETKHKYKKKNTNKEKNKLGV